MVGNAAEDLGDEGLNGVGVGFDGSDAELGALGTLARGVADAARGATDERDGGVATPAEPGERDEAEEVAEMQALGGGVEAAVNLEVPGTRFGERLRGGGLDEPSLHEHVHDAGRRGAGGGSGSGSGGGGVGGEAAAKRVVVGEEEATVRAQEGPRGGGRGHGGGGHRAAGEELMPVRLGAWVRVCVRG